MHAVESEDGVVPEGMLTGFMLRVPCELVPGLQIVKSEQKYYYQPLVSDTDSIAS